MIIKDNFDKKNALPTNNDYKKVGKGSMNVDKKLEVNKNINPFFQIDENTERENDEEEIRDKWDFFK